MLVEVLDAQGDPHFVVWQGQDQINDNSGNLGAGAVGNAPVPQQVAAANASRAGFLFQNTSAWPMLLQEIVLETTASSWLIAPGAYFPPIPGYPVPTGEITVCGTNESQQGDTYAARDWQDAAGE